jgi:hypothetical protein
MSSCILLDLPEVVARHLLVNWLDLKLVVRLDSAFCSGTFYTQFSIMAYGQFTVYSVHQYSTSPKFVFAMQWAALRYAQLDGIYVNEWTSKRTLFTFLTMSRNAVRWVSCFCDFKTDCSVQMKKLTEIGRWCPNIERFGLICWRSDVLWDDCLTALTTSLQKLTKLTLCDSVKLSTGGLITALNRCRCMESLHLNTILQRVPVEIAISTLKSITIKSVHLSDAVLIAIAQKCVKLETLLVFGGYKREHLITDEVVRAVLQGCPLLRETDFEYAKSISDELRVELARRRDYKCLDFGRWCNISDELAQEVLKVCPNLTELQCRCCGRITDATLLICAQHCPPLKAINFTGCPLVTIEGVRALVSKAASRLRTVEIHKCPQLGDEMALVLAEHCPLLEHFESDPKMSNAAVGVLVRHCVRLRRKPMGSGEAFWIDVRPLVLLLGGMVLLTAVLHIIYPPGHFQ